MSTMGIKVSDSKSSDLRDSKRRLVMIGSKGKDSYSIEKPSSKLLLISNPHETNSYS